jgi:dolichol kinase
MWGRHKFLDKSREGTIAFVLTAWMVVLAVPKAEGLWIEYVIGAFAAVIGALFEAASVRLRLDDNLAIPLSVGGVMWLCYYLLQRFDPAQYHSLWVALMAFD